MEKSVSMQNRPPCGSLTCRSRVPTQSRPALSHLASLNTSLVKSTSGTAIDVISGLSNYVVAASPFFVTMSRPPAARGITALGAYGSSRTSTSPVVGRSRSMRRPTMSIQ